MQTVETPQPLTVAITSRALFDLEDGHTLFEAIGDAIRTGPTLTNVNDIRAILIV